MQFKLTIHAESATELARIAKHLGQLDAPTETVAAPAPPVEASPSTVFAPSNPTVATGFTQEPVVATVAPSVPQVPVPPAASPTPVGVVEVLDAKGFPWDARIHSGAKTRVQADDTWKLIRGIDKSIVEAVRAEYLASKGVATPAPAVSTPTPVAEVTQPAPVVNLPPALPVAAPAAPTTGGVTADNVKELLTSNLANRLLDAPAIGALLKNAGVANLPDIVNHPAKLEDLFASISLYVRLAKHKQAGTIDDNWLTSVMAHFGLAMATDLTSAQGLAVGEQIEEYLVSIGL